MKQDENETKKSLEKFISANKKGCNQLYVLKLVKEIFIFLLTIALIYSPCFQVKKGMRSMFTNVVDFFLKKPDNFQQNLWFYLIYALLVLFQFFLAAYMIYLVVMDFFSIKNRKEIDMNILSKKKEKFQDTSLFIISIICFIVYILFHYLLTKKEVEKPINLYILIPIIAIVIAIILVALYEVKKQKLIKEAKQYQKDQKTK